MVQVVVGDENALEAQLLFLQGRDHGCGVPGIHDIGLA
jgi:hypothetical protein